MTKRSPTTKDIGLLRQLFTDGQLTLAPEFQRNSVWPTAAKAYLIDTILNDRPIPLFFFQRITAAQTGRPAYAVIDGQQRLRAIFDYLDNRFRLSQSQGQPFHNRRFQDLTSDQQARIRDYDLIVEELSGYSDADIRDMFVRMNRYVVKLSPQELRHARAKGAFHDFVERLGRWDFWKVERVFTITQLKRMRAVEFSAELTVLLIEGPQDKKSAIDLYYGQYRDSFPQGKAVETRLKTFRDWVKTTLPDLPKHRYRSPVDLYSLIAALDIVSDEGKRLSRIKPPSVRDALLQFEEETRQAEPTGDAARYVVAASRQTDNIAPRTTRISILTKLLRSQ